MFTGIVERIGEVTATAADGDGARITIHAPGIVADASHGDSISVSGVCLTVVDRGDDWFAADVMQQTLSTARVPGTGERVNLERATPAHGRLGGHIVQGHVDSTAEVIQVRPGQQWRVIRLRLDPTLAPLVVDKGSIALDGVSLTISAVSSATESEPWCEVSLIPETLQATTLGERTVGDVVNVESDILARHVQRLLAFAPDGARATATEGAPR